MFESVVFESVAEEVTVTQIISDRILTIRLFEEDKKISALFICFNL